MTWNFQIGYKKNPILFTKDTVKKENFGKIEGIENDIHGKSLGWLY